jgi:hypothetical protein
MKNTKLIGVSANILVLVCFSLSVFAQTPVWKGKIFKDGEVTVVQNPREPIYKGEILTLKEDLRLGGPEAKGDYAFNGIITLTVDGQDNIFVLDYKDSHIKVFDKTGKYLRTIGRKGQGPGELNGVRSVAIERSSGMLFVLEMGSRRVSCFDVQGKFLKSLPFKGDIPATMALDSKGRIYIVEAVLSDKESSYVFKKFTSDLNSASTLVKGPTGVSPTGAADAFRPIPTFTIDAKDQFIYGFPKTYELQYFGVDGKPVRRILKDHTPVEVTPAEIEEVKKDTPPGIKVDFGKNHAAFRKIFSDGEGRLFVQTFEKTKAGKGRVFDIFDAEGRFVGTVPLADVPVLFRKGSLYSLEEDEDGYQIIKRYALTWKLK